MLFTKVKKKKKSTVTLLYIQMMEYYVAINNDSMTENKIINGRKHPNL